MANESQQSFPEHSQRVESQNRIQEMVKSFIEKIFVDRKKDAEVIEDFQKMGAEPEDIEAFQDAARKKEQIAALIVKKKQQAHVSKFSAAPNPYANLDEIAKRVKQEQVPFIDEPVIPKEMPQAVKTPLEEVVPKPERMVFSADEKRQQNTVDLDIQKLQNAFMEADPQRWLEIVSNPNFALLAPESIRKPGRIEAKKWLDKQLDELKGKEQLKKLVANITTYRTSRPVRSDYYSVLGVEKTADLNEIKSKYRALIPQFHPDAYSQAVLLEGTNGTEARDFSLAAQNITKELNTAYAVLSDKEERSKYDMRGSAPAQETSGRQQEPASYGSKERDKDTIDRLLNNLRTATQVTQLRMALESLRDLGHEFFVPAGINNPDRYETPQDILDSLDELDDLLQNGDTDGSSFESVLKSITRTEGIRESVKAVYEPIRRSIVTLKSNASTPYLVDSLRELVKRDFVFSVQTKTLDGTGMETVLRYPIDAIRAIESVMSAKSAQEAVDNAAKVTSLYKLDLKALSHIQRNTQGSRSLNWNWSAVKYPPRIEKRYRDFLSGR